jgi:hypothetical protein
VVHADASLHEPREPLGALLLQLRAVVQAQAEALEADDFDGLESLTTEREQLVVVLGGYTAADTRPDDRALIEQVGALDQRLIALAREGLERTSQELRDLHRGRGALNEYRRRGQNLIVNLAQLADEG